MKKMITFVILVSWALAFMTACSQGTASPSSGADENQTDLAFNCKNLIGEVKNQNDLPVSAILKTLVSSAGKNQMTLEQAIQCLDQNLLLQCSSQTCSIQERN